MKFFVLIFLSLFLVRAHSQQNLNLNIPMSDQTVDKILEQKAADKAEAKKEREGKICTDAYKEYTDNVKTDRVEGREEREKAEDKISELKKDKNEAITKAQEDIAAEDEKLAKAQTAYKEAQDDLTEQQNAFEKETNEQADQMIQDLQKDQATFQKLTTTDMDKINTDYQNDLSKQYGECKNNAEQLFAARIGLDRQSNKLENQGLKKTGGATFATGSAIKKAKAEAKTVYSKCISETNRVLGANRASAVKDLLTQQKAAEQEINNKKIKLDRLTNGEYTKKMTSFQEKLRTAQLEFTNVQNQVNTNKQRIQQAVAQKTLTFDQDIAMYQQRIDVVDDKNKTRSKDKDGNEDTTLLACTSAQSACCIDQEPKEPFTNMSFCKKKCEKKVKAYQRKGDAPRGSGYSRGAH